MKILVTGGSGFIGGTIARYLAEFENNTIVATGRSNCPSNISAHNIEYLKLSLNEPLPELEFDVCIHSAGLADDKSSNTELYVNNVLATENLIQHLKNCKLFILRNFHVRRKSMLA